MRSASRSTAASVSSVGTSPAQAITTSGSPPSSLLAHRQMPMPAVAMLDRRVHVEPLRAAGCLPATITFT